MWVVLMVPLHGRLSLSTRPLKSSLRRWTTLMRLSWLLEPCWWVGNLRIRLLFVSHRQLVPFCSLAVKNLGLRCCNCAAQRSYPFVQDKFPFVYHVHRHSTPFQGSAPNRLDHALACPEDLASAMQYTYSPAVCRRIT